MNRNEPAIVMPCVLASMFLIFTFLGGCGSSGPVNNTPPSTPPATITSVSVSCTTSSVQVGQTSQCNQTVIGTGNFNQSVTWSVNTVQGGNSIVGTISAAGLYVAPDPVPSPNSVNITATSVGDPTKSAGENIAVVYPVPAIAAISPNSGSIGSSATQVTITGNGFTRSSQVIINGSSTPATFTSTTQISGAIPASTLIAAGNLAISVSNPTPQGGISNSAQFSVLAGTLMVTINGLPSGTKASVVISGPNGFNVSVTGAQTLANLIPGSYTLAVSPVSDNADTYYPSTNSQSILVGTNSPASALVNYTDDVPSTTKVLDAVGMQTMTLSTDGATVSISSLSTVAGQLQAGDVLVSAPTAGAPTGLAFNVSSVTITSEQVILTGSPATLADIFKSANIHLQQTVDPNQAKASSILRPSLITITALPATWKSSKVDKSSTTSEITNSCAGKPSLQVDVPDTSFDSAPAITVGGSLQLCPAFEMNVVITPPLNLQSASATLSLGQHANLDFSDQISTTLSLNQQLGSPIQLGTYTFLVDGVPVSVTPTATISVSFEGNAQAGLSSSIEEDASGSVGISYVSGQTPTLINSFQSPVFSPIQPFQIIGNASAKALFNVRVDFHLYQETIFGVDVNPIDVSPYVELSPFLGWQADITQNPWWTLNAGVDGTVGISVKAIDKTIADPSVTKELFSTTIATSGGPFFPPANITKILPSPVVAAATAQTILISGTGFGTNPIVVLCLKGTCSSPSVLVGSTSTQLQVSAVLSTGTWTAQVTAGGSKSNVFPFVVNQPAVGLAINGLQPAVPNASSSDQILKFIGTEMQAGLSVKLCQSVCLPVISGSQIISVATDGSSVQLTALIATGGQWTAYLLNPDGTTSQPFPFLVIGPLFASVSPVSGSVGQTQFTVSGTGASRNGIVSTNSMWPDGSSHVSSALADSTGGFTFGPFIRNLAGVYSETYTDQTSGAVFGPVTYAVGATAGTPTIISVNPPSPIVNSQSQQLVFAGSGFVPSSIVRLSNATSSSVFATQVQIVGATQIQCQATLPSSGIWQAQIINPGGIDSVPFSFSVQPNATLATITGITPAAIIASTSSQTLSLIGSGFKSGINVTLSGNGTTSTYSGSQVISVSNSLIQFNAVVASPGAWTATVVNSDSTSSNSFQFSVQGGSGSVSVSPNSFSPVFTVGDPAATLGFFISNQSGGSLLGSITATTTSGGQWLTVNGHPSDTWVAPETENVTANPAGLAAGTYQGSLTVSSPNPPSAVTIPVTMTIFSLIQITTTSLPDAVSGQSYSSQLQASGGTGTGYTWSLVSGTLPVGISLNPQTGTLSGTAGLISGGTTETLNFAVQDSNGHLATKTLSLIWRQALAILPYSPSNFQFNVGTPYTLTNSLTLQAVGGTAPYTWSATGMPAGLSVTANSGLITGTPAQPGTVTASVKVTDANSQSTTSSVTFFVVTTQLNITDSTGHTPPNVPSGIVGVAYSQLLNAVGGSQSGFVWSVQGTVPPGITASQMGCPPTCGFQITGTPTQAGTYTFTVQVKDSLNDTTQQPITIVINTGTPPQITSTTLPLGTVGQTYSFTFGASGGAGGYQWSLVGNAPDSGLQLSSGGVLSGTSSVANDCPTGPGLWLSAGPSTFFQVQVKDSLGQSSVHQFCVPAYYPTPQITNFAPPNVTVDGQTHAIAVNGIGFRNNAFLFLNGGGTVPTTFVSNSVLSFKLSPVVGAAFSTGGPTIGDGNAQLWIVQPYSTISNQVNFTTFDPVPAVSGVTAVLNNTSQPCTSNLNCQVVISGSGFVYDSTYQVAGQSLNSCVASTPSTPIPWNTVTSCAFSVSAPGTYTVVVTNPNQPGGGTASAVGSFTVAH